MERQAYTLCDDTNRILQKHLFLGVLIQIGSSFIETEEFALGSDCTYGCLLRYIFVMSK